MRPASILWFERIYLSAWLINVVTTLVLWKSVVARSQAMPSVQVWATGFSFLIPIVFWYFIARRASVVAKWVLVVFVSLGTLSVIAATAMAKMPAGVSGAIAYTSIILQVIAVVMLFRPDTRPWFGEDDVIADHSEEDLPA